MGFAIPNNAVLIGLKLMAVATQVMQEAEAENGPFSGHGTGEQKKAFVMKRAREMDEIQNLISAELMTKEQETAVLATFDKWVEAIFSSWETAKLFKATPAA